MTLPFACTLDAGVDVSELDASGWAYRESSFLTHPRFLETLADNAPPWAGNCLRDPAPLLALLGAHASAAVVLHGHLHADMASVVGRARVYCTPSTCTQTLLVSPDWAKDTAASPGFRLLRLHADGTHDTEVRRVDISHCKAPL